MSPKAKTCLTIFLLNGLFLLALAAYLIVQNSQREASWTRTTGSVIDMRAKRPVGNTVGAGQVSRTTYAPVVSFTTRDGDHQTFENAFYTDPPQFHVGDTVQLLYNPANHGEAMLCDVQSEWLIPGLCAAFGFVFTAIGGGALAASRMRTQPTGD